MLRPRNRGNSLYSIDGAMKGATVSWNFADALVENTNTALPAVPASTQTHIQPVGIAEVVAEPDT